MSITFFCPVTVDGDTFEMRYELRQNASGYWDAIDADVDLLIATFDTLDEAIAFLCQQKIKN